VAASVAGEELIAAVGFEPTTSDYEFKRAVSRNMLSLAESVVLSARYTWNSASKQGFCANLRPSFRS
jgi:hypothetical protein